MVLRLFGIPVGLFFTVMGASGLALAGLGVHDDDDTGRTAPVTAQAHEADANLHTGGMTDTAQDAEVLQTSDHKINALRDTDPDHGRPEDNARAMDTSSGSDDEENF